MSKVKLISAAALISSLFALGAFAYPSASPRDSSPVPAFFDLTKTDSEGGHPLKAGVECVMRGLNAYGEPVTSAAEDLSLNGTSLHLRETYSLAGSRDEIKGMKAALKKAEAAASSKDEEGQNSVNQEDYNAEVGAMITDQLDPNYVGEAATVSCRNVGEETYTDLAVSSAMLTLETSFKGGATSPYWDSKVCLCKIAMDLGIRDASKRSAFFARLKRDPALRRNYGLKYFGSTSVPYSGKIVAERNWMF